MAITEQDIRRLRREVERDLEALSRVEAMLARRNGIGPAEHATTDKRERGQLKQLTIEAVKSAGAIGIRPGEVLKTVRDKGYPFKSDSGAAASISTVLSRLLKAKCVEKKDKAYVWKIEMGRE